MSLLRTVVPNEAHIGSPLLADIGLRARMSGCAVALDGIQSMPTLVCTMTALCDGGSRTRSFRKR